MNSQKNRPRLLFWVPTTCLSCKPNIYVSWSTSTLRVRLARRETSLSSPVNIFTDHSKAVLLLWIIYAMSCFRYAFVRVLWSPAGKGLTSWLSCVMSNCEVVTFPLVSWVRCGAWLYRFLIFVLFLTLNWKVRKYLQFNAKKMLI